MKDEVISPGEVLKTAANVTGGEERLATFLKVDLIEVQAWMHGTRPPPFGTCIYVLAFLERQRQPLAQEQRGDLSTGAIAGTLACGSLERVVRLAGMTSLVFIVGFLFGVMTLSTFTKLIVGRNE
jgi:hypothetical protein